MSIPVVYSECGENSDPVSARSAVSNLEMAPKFISGESKIRDCRKMPGWKVGNAALVFHKEHLEI